MEERVGTIDDRAGESRKTTKDRRKKNRRDKKQGKMRKAFKDTAVGSYLLRGVKSFGSGVLAGAVNGGLSGVVGEFNEEIQQATDPKGKELLKKYTPWIIVAAVTVLGLIIMTVVLTFKNAKSTKYVRK